MGRNLFSSAPSSLDPSTARCLQTYLLGGRRRPTLQNVVHILSIQCMCNSFCCRYRRQRARYQLDFSSYLISIHIRGHTDQVSRSPSPRRPPAVVRRRAAWRCVCQFNRMKGQHFCLSLLSLLLRSRRRPSSRLIPRDHFLVRAPTTRRMNARSRGGDRVARE